jgi:hypothetical protein
MHPRAPAATSRSSLLRVVSAVSTTTEDVSVLRFLQQLREHELSRYVGQAQVQEHEVGAGRAHGVDAQRARGDCEQVDVWAPREDLVEQLDVRRVVLDVDDGGRPVSGAPGAP